MNVLSNDDISFLFSWHKRFKADLDIVLNKASGEHSLQVKPELLTAREDGLVAVSSADQPVNCGGELGGI